MPKRKTYTTLAVIHLGSEMIRMQIVEFRSLRRFKVIEQCDYPIRLGEESFKHKIIPFPMVEEICQVLQGFRELMQDYGVEVYRAQATTAVREARNQVYLLDQVKLRTGLTVEVTEMPMEIYTKFIAIRHTLAEQHIPTDEGMMLIDISSGGLGITGIESDKITFQENFHIGIIRIKESFNYYQRSSQHFNRALMQFLASTTGPVKAALRGRSMRYLVISGTETELLLKILGKKSAGPGGLTHLTRDEFMAVFDEIRNLNLPQMIQLFHVTEDEAEIMLPMILLYEQLLSLVPTAQEIIVSDETFIDGMRLRYIVQQKEPEYAAGLEDELLSLVHHVGENYHYDYSHVSQVEKISLAIFDKIGRRYGLNDHHRLLLRAACILHDIGKYVSMRSHSLYSYQLIMGTDIIGFTEEDKQIIALASYYHAHNVLEGDFGDHSLVKPPVQAEIPLVAKLSAIVRLADALDRSYLQKIDKVKVQIQNRELVLKVHSRMDLDLEEWVFASKATMLEEVYGIEVRLEREL